MAEIQTNFAKARKGLRLPIGGTHLVSISPFSAHKLEFQDAFFRTGSATVLPEGETPVSNSRGGINGPGSSASSPPKRSALSSVGAFATLLRFNEEHPDRKILIAGHTDTEGKKTENQALSEDRGRAVHALLMGERDAFVTAADKRHKIGDYKQILKWASIELDDLEAPAGAPTPAAGFIDCDPGAVDEDEFTGIEPLKAFQRAYNANKQALGASAEDLKVDGSIGPKTWGAIFDCYEFALRVELGEDANEMNVLRAKLAFLPLDKPFVGFGESHPVEAAGQDGLRAQANRRVEVLFFEAGEEPDLDVLKNTPEKTELYKPEIFSRILIPALGTAKRTKVELRLESRDGNRIPDIGFIATLSDGSERKGRLGRQGTAVIKAPPDATFVVEYQDQDDIRTKALAARLSKALDKGDHQLITGSLAVAEPVFQAIKKAVEKFFPRPGDLIAEIRTKTKGTASENAAGYFLAGVGFPDSSGTGPGDLIAFDESRIGSQNKGTAVA